MIRNLALGLMTTLLVSSSAQAQSSAPKPVNDRLFAAAAACGGMTEIALSELGEQKATHPDLKKFSKEMVAAHTKMNGELASLAAAKGVALPKTLSHGATFCAESLAGLSGEEFDRCYAKAQTIAHEEAVSTFEAEAERGQDPEMKALAAKALPHIKEHLKMIKPIHMKLEHEKHGEK